MDNNPTELERSYLRLIAYYPADPAHPYPPTYREMAAHFGVSVGTIQGHMDDLKRKGLVTWKPQASRTFSLTPQGAMHV